MFLRFPQAVTQMLRQPLHGHYAHHNTPPHAVYSVPIRLGIQQSTDVPERHILRTCTSKAINTSTFSAHLQVDHQSTDHISNFSDTLHVPISTHDIIGLLDCCWGGWVGQLSFVKNKVRSQFNLQSSTSATSFWMACPHSEWGNIKSRSRWILLRIRHYLLQN